jgi:hypothetical protein
MKRPNADEIARWLMDDTLVADGRPTHSDGSWSDWIRIKNLITGWDEIRVSIATVEGKPVFEGNTYYNEYGQERSAQCKTWDKAYWSKCTLTPPKPKSILDSDEFNTALGKYISNVDCQHRSIEQLKQFIRDNKEKI